MSRQVIVDMDDLCDNVLLQWRHDKQVYLVDFLLKWKERVPGLKLTAFTIPRRTSKDTIRIFKKSLEWVALAPHGWEHTRGECLSWSKPEAVAKLKMAADMGINAPVFRAPAWLINQETYEACRELGYTVASHATIRIAATGVSEYIYNHHMGRPKKSVAIHGHFTPVCNNWLYDMEDRGLLSTPAKATFLWAHEAGVAVPPHVAAVDAEKEVAMEVE